MANFNTHLTVALAVSSSLATAGLVVGAFGFMEMMILAIIGAIGGLLPDIDLDHSKISQLVFTSASVFGASFLLFLYQQYRPIDPLEALIFWGVLVLFLKFIVFGLFAKFTKHRGMVHSIPYMAVSSLLLTLLSYHTLKLSDSLSWLFGGFLFAGALVHLILDEIYSVNIYGLKVKKSFGTAFKFFESKKPKQYAILYAILIGLIIISPPKTALIKLLLPILAMV